MIRNLVASSIMTVVAAWFGWRAVEGIRGDRHYLDATRSAARGDHHRALRLLERTDVGFDRFESTWLRAETRLALWDEAAEASGPESADPTLLDAARRELVRGSRICPPSAWSWSSLALAYGRLGALARRREPLDLSRLEENSWGIVVREQAIAIGMARQAVRLEPKVFRHWDVLAMTLLNAGLDSEARDAIRESGAVQPGFHFHRELDFDRLPREMVEAFADGARAAIGRAPMLPLERHRLFLGELERRLGRSERAVEDFRAALAEHGPELSRAEANFHLGLALVDLGRGAEAEAALEEAGRHPAFALAALDHRARLAEAEGRDRDALDLLQAARRLSPRDPELARRVAAVAERLGETSQAREARREEERLRNEAPP